MLECTRLFLRISSGTLHFHFFSLSFFPIAAFWEKPKDSKVVIPGQTGSSS